MEWEDIDHNKMQELAYIFNLKVCEIIDEYELWHDAKNSYFKDEANDTYDTFLEHMQHLFDAVN